MLTTKQTETVLNFEQTKLTLSLKRRELLKFPYWVFQFLIKLPLLSFLCLLPAAELPRFLYIN